MASKSGGPPLRIVGSKNGKKETQRKVKSGYDQEFTLPAGTSAAPIKFNKTQAKKDASKKVVTLQPKKKPGPKQKKKLKKGQYRIANYDKDIFDPGFGKRTKIVNYKPKVYKSQTKWDTDNAAGKLREGDTLKTTMPLNKNQVREMKIMEKYRHLPFRQYQKKVAEELKKPFLVKGKKD